MPADEDISKPVGQAEASKLIAVRDDLDMLSPAQPDVPCCSGVGAHDESLEGQPTEQKQGRPCASLDTASAQQLSEVPAWQPGLSHSATAVHGAAQAGAAPAGCMRETHAASQSDLHPAELARIVQPRAVHGSAPGGVATERGLLHGLPPPEMQQLGVHGYLDRSAMQQASASGLFDPTAAIGHGQSPAANGFGSHSSPLRTGAAGKPPCFSL